MQEASVIKLPGTLSTPITLRQYDSNALIINDNKHSLLLRIRGNDMPRLSAANRSDLPAQLPNHLLAAALDYLFAKNPAVLSITIDDELTQRLENKGLVHSKGSEPDTPICIRQGFYQDRTLWHWQGNSQPAPEIWTRNDSGTEHPVRQKQPAGTVYERYDYQNDVTVSFRSIDPEQDLSLFHNWMNQPRVNKFWEMAKSRDELQEYIRTLLADTRTWPLIGCFNGEPFGYMELYWAMEDRLAPYYDCQPWDRGFHLLVGNKKFLGPRFSLSWTRSISHFLFLDDPRTMRLVGEPRADNKRLMKLLEPAGWEFVKEFDFPHKRAALVHCHRKTFFQDIQL
ncbi:acetyltransferase [Endozoicomonas gorgoniicola]|uniref:Acetyltransferase n=1 Tax=Endozoicomonas gorgoniicola TaxID=1234144 RepID=A0ABT3N0I9_9GAMM|nr:GNAT family N-acetyltransferase [Endozoicomonas gorgoniicola]MCW7555147.1 acetyltransferase [Endozoicomonas gorgoniicola]